jgi:hypothetical protein
MITAESKGSTIKPPESVINNALKIFAGKPQEALFTITKAKLLALEGNADSALNILTSVPHTDLY